MKRSQGKSQPEQRSAHLAKTKRRIDIGDEFCSNRVGEAHSRFRSEGVIVGQVEVVVSPELDRVSPTGPELEEETEGARVEDEVSSKESDTIPSTTRLKYNRFKRDGNQDVDDWLTEFESTALANQEEPATKQQIFQSLLKGEALKWY